MNINVKNFRYKKVVSIIEVGKSLSGILLEFKYGSKDINESEILISSRIIHYYDQFGEAKHDSVSKVNVGDYIIEYL